MILVSCVCDLLRSGGDLSSLRRLWDRFTSALVEREPEFVLNWSRSETVISFEHCSLTLILTCPRTWLVFLWERDSVLYEHDRALCVSSFMCQRLASRVLRLLLRDISPLKEHRLQYEKEGHC